MGALNIQSLHIDVIAGGLFSGLTGLGAAGEVLLVVIR